ncbi:GNAT family N-acetyltransferase [Candidatus Pacearchaeota archaeon]|nr:GNAT family N-acetyltransferase [Candidatus Pacearchaeota archaeon]
MDLFTQAKKREISEIRKIIVANLLTINSKDYDSETIKMLVKDYSIPLIKKRMSEGEMFVAKRNNKIIGVGRFNNGEIFDVFVVPEKQGEGIGKTIMLHLERIAIKKGFTKVFLPASKTAIKFYEKRGYKRVKDYKISDSSCWMFKELKE